MVILRCNSASLLVLESANCKYHFLVGEIYYFSLIQECSGIELQIGTDAMGRVNGVEPLAGEEGIVNAVKPAAAGA